MYSLPEGVSATGWLLNSAKPAEGHCIRPDPLRIQPNGIRRAQQDLGVWQCPAQMADQAREVAAGRRFRFDGPVEQAELFTLNRLELEGETIEQSARLAPENGKRTPGG